MTKQILDRLPAAMVGSICGGLLVCWLMADHCQVSELKAQNKAVTGVIKAERKAVDLSNDAGAKAVTKIEEVKANTLTLIQKVPIHVPIKNDDSDRLSIGLARLHDAAADGLPDLPAAPRTADEALSPFTKTDLAFAIAINYGQYHECTETLTGLQDWTSAQHELSVKELSR